MSVARRSTWTGDFTTRFIFYSLQIFFEPISLGRLIYKQICRLNNFIIIFGIKFFGSVSLVKVGNSKVQDIY